MVKRAGLFEADFDVSAFAPKEANTVQPLSEEVRVVSEAAKFQSREPVQAFTAKLAQKKQSRRRRTGRNIQLNLKVAAAPLELFYKITDHQGWVLGETFERAVEALQRELIAQK